ncbi:MAG: Rid family detoxifying hydrolase [Candidatus Muiribacteriota bacterium]
MHNNVIKTDKLPAPVGPYSIAVMNGNIIYLSGQLPVDMQTGHLETESASEATKIIMNNIQNFLKENNLKMENIIKSTIYIKDMNKFNDFNREYAKFFKNDYSPARECVQPEKLPKNVAVEISAIIES